MQVELEDLTEGLVRGRLTVGELAGLTPRELDALYALCTERIDTGHIADAQVMLAALVTLFPFSSRYWRAYGIALQRLLQLPQARAAYDAALLIEPNHAFTLCHRGEVLLYLGQQSEAQRDLEATAACADLPLKARQGPARVDAQPNLAATDGPPLAPQRPQRIPTDHLSLSDGRTLPLPDSRIAKAARGRMASSQRRAAGVSATAEGLKHNPTPVTSSKAREISETAIVRRSEIRPPSDAHWSPSSEGTDTAIIRQRDLQPRGGSMQEKTTRAAVAQRRNGLPLTDDNDASDNGTTI